MTNEYIWEILEAWKNIWEVIKHRVVVESPAEVSGKGLLCVRLILRPTRRQRRQRRRRHRR